MVPFVLAGVTLVAGLGLAFLMAYADYMRAAPTNTTSPFWVAGATIVLSIIIASTHWW